MRRALFAIVGAALLAGPGCLVATRPAGHTHYVRGAPACPAGYYWHGNKCKESKEHKEYRKDVKHDQKEREKAAKRAEKEERKENKKHGHDD